MSLDAYVRGQVGEDRLAAGSWGPVRLGPYTDAIVSQLHPPLFEASRVGKLFHVSTGLAIALNVASPLGAAGTAPFALFNPLGSNKAAVVRRAAVLQLVGATPVLNAAVWNVNPSAGITAAGNVTPLNGLIGGVGSAMRAYSSAALTGGSAFTLLRPFDHVVGSESGTVTSGDVYGQHDDTDGSIIVPPGAAVAVVFNVAGTNITGAIAAEWEEIDWPLS